MKSEIFKRELSYIRDGRIREFAERALNQLPDYFFSVPASSSGKYHPDYALGDGGLVRHTKAAARFAWHLLGLEQSRAEFTPQERDCIICAILLHDGFKQGDGRGGHTIHEHPMVCAEWIRGNPKLDDLISPIERERIAGAVASHMGEWNYSNRSDLHLEKPVTALQKFVHMCDYLASRKDIEVRFDEDADEPVLLEGQMETYALTFGKYKGQLLVDVFRENRGYVKWMNEKMTLWEPLRSYVEQLLAATKA